MWMGHVMWMSHVTLDMYDVRNVNMYDVRYV